MTHRLDDVLYERFIRGGVQLNADAVDIKPGA